jgi:hypothetical protein
VRQVTPTAWPIRPLSTEAVGIDSPVTGSIDLALKSKVRELAKSCGWPTVSRASMVCFLRLALLRRGPNSSDERSQTCGK